MKTCAACHEDLPKDKFSKKQWKLNQRRCKVCIANNREVQQLPSTTNNKPDDDKLDCNETIRLLLGSMSMNEKDMIPVSDEELIKQPPQEEDCPICFIRMPSIWTGYKYKVCCGKLICNGCIYANAKLTEDEKCAFCRTPAPTKEKEMIQRTLKRMQMNDPHALFNFGGFYEQGMYGISQNQAKALKLLHRAGELGHALSYHNIGNAYYKGNGVEQDKKKAVHYYNLAAIGGHSVSRHNVGVIENNIGNGDRALKHYMISAGVGFGDSLKEIKHLFMDGYATKDDYAKALRSSQDYIDEIRTDQRDKAAAVDDRYQYY